MYQGIEEVLIQENVIETLENEFIELDSVLKSKTKISKKNFFKEYVVKNSWCFMSYNIFNSKI